MRNYEGLQRIARMGCRTRTDASIYGLTRQFPREEIYGLTSQVRRSAASIGVNIAEGCGRRSDGEMARFLQIARGSASETEYHMLLAKDLGLVSPTEFHRTEQKLLEVQRMLTVLAQKVQQSRQFDQA